MTSPPAVTEWPRSGVGEVEVEVAARPRLLIARRASETVEIRAVLPTVRLGNAVNSSERAVLAATFGRRTEGRDPDELDDAFAAQGGSCVVAAEPGCLLVRAFAHRVAVDSALGLVSELVAAPAYAHSEVETATRTVAADLRVRHASNAARLEDAVQSIAFAGGPLAERPDPDAVVAVTASRIEQVHRASLGPDGSTVVIVGDVNPEAIASRMSELGRSWSGPLAEAQSPERTAVMGEIVLIDRPGSTRAGIALVAAGPPRSEADFPALAAAIRIVGGTATSRISRRLRERRGWAYTATMMYRGFRSRPAVVVNTEVSQQFAAAAVNELMYELGRVSSSPLTTDEIADATRGLAGRRAVDVHTPAGLADYLAQLAVEDPNLEVGATLAERAAALGAENVLAVAQRYLAPRRVTTVVVADARQAEPALATLGPVRVVTDPR